MRTRSTTTRGWISVPARRRWRHRAIIVLVGLLALVLGIDPTLVTPGASTTNSAAAAEVNPGLESRAEHLDAVVDGLGMKSPISATTAAGAWPAIPASGSTAVLPAATPAEDEEVVTLASTPTATNRQAATAPSAEIDLGGMDVTVAAADGPTPEAVKLRVAGDSETQNAGITGILLDVTDASPQAVADGEVDLTVSYASFAGLGDADWASRLQLVRIPSCESAAPECAPEILPTTNNIDEQTVSAVVPVAASTEPVAQVASFGAQSAVTASSGGAIAVTAAAAGPAGNWGATKLAPSSSWGTSGNTGAFTWSYPFEVPPVQAGPTPELALSYSSAASDGRTPATNNQAGWLGEGFELSTGYIERSYVPCDQDQNGGNNAGRPSGDLCWGAENATMVFQGSAVELIKDAATGAWKAKNDDGARIEHLTGGAFNGGEANEYWKVTTPDGIQYVFGRGQRSANDTTALNSAWTVPVYGNHAGDRCYKAPAAGGFAASKCDQVWRWNLEYVTDLSGNSMTYRYEKDTNGYVYDYTTNLAGTIANYTSGGRLASIEYGTRTGSETARPAPAKVVFTAAPRCVTDAANGASLCNSTQTSPSTFHYLDTPSDLRCTAAGCDNFTPVFFDQHRLADVSTQSYDGTTYRTISRWELRHRFVSQGSTDIRNASGTMLRLESVRRSAPTRTGATAVTLPANEFGYTFFPNRVDGVDDGSLALERPRMSTVRTETGGTVSVNYRTECSAGDLPGDDENAQRGNQRLCYPVKWASGSATGGEVDYFHKYVVTSTVEQGAPAGANALITGSLDKTTTYTYEGGAHWAKPTGAMVRPGEVTYSDFRGFATLTTTLGLGDEASSTKTRYYRGTGGQLQAGPAGHRVTVTDHERFQGQILEATELNGSKVVSQTVTQPGTPTTVATGAGGATATRLPSTTAYGFTFGDDQSVAARTRTVTSFNDNSQPVTIDDLGDVSSSADNRCTRITYTPDHGAKHLVSLPAQTETVAKACDQPVNRPADVLADNAASYDGAGRLTQTLRLDPSDGIGLVLERNVGNYDELGRPRQFVDAAGQTTTVSYQSSAGGQLAAVTTVTPDVDGAGPLGGLSTVTAYNPLDGTVASTTDANGKVTSGGYDGLGRLLRVQHPQHDRPSVIYTYTSAANGLNTVMTSTIAANGIDYHRSAELHDGLLRPIQTQVEGRDAGENRNAAASARGRMVSHTFYDTAGRVSKQTGQWWNTGVPQPIMLVPPAVTPSHTTVDYDGAGRPITEVFWTGTDSNPAYERWRTTVGYDGLTTTTVPPMGQTPTATTVDARDQVVRLREYVRDADTHSGADTVGEVLALTSQDTTYTYDAAGRRTGMHDPADNAWSYAYDWAGRQIVASDPDGGTTSTTYNNLDQVVTRKNAKNQTLAYTYDPLGRTTSQRDGSATGTARVTWTYDTATDSDGTRLLGPLSATTRHLSVKEAPLTVRVGKYTDDYRVSETTLDDPGLALQTAQYAYTADGQIASTTYPAADYRYGANPKIGPETVTTQYDTASMPMWMSGGFGWGTYVAESRFTADGRPVVMDLGNTYGAVVSYQYEDGTDRLLNTALDREGVSGTDVDIAYTYDAAGNVTSMKDVPTNAALNTARSADQQCFKYDGLQRLDLAWSDKDGNCDRTASGVTSSVIGGAAQYLMKLEYDEIGNRTKLESETAYGIDRFRSIITDYTYGTGPAGPHALTDTNVTRDGSPVSGKTFTYDTAGNRATEKLDSATSSSNFYWDAEGELTGAPGESYVYDGNGDRLVRTAGAVKTVYFAGQEISVANGSVTSATRNYSFAGRTVAVRQASGMGGVTSVMTDHHGTAIAGIPNTVWTNTSVKKIYTDPFGALRDGGTGTAAIPGDRQFLNAPRDSTGLTQIGARYYDETIGTFISVDPLLDPGNPAQFNAYVYAGNNPLTWSDPSGLAWNPWKAATDWVGGAAKNVGNFVNKYQAEIVGAVVGVAVTAGCLAITAGAGSIGCMVAGGAAAGAVTSLYKSAQTGKFSVGGLIRDTVFGGLTGFAGGALGNVAGSVIRAAAPAVTQFASNAIREGARVVTSKAPQIAQATQRAAQSVQRAITQRSSASTVRTQATSCSFVGATLVLMADGTKKPISEIEVGDMVTASDPQTGVQGPRPVTEVFVHEDTVVQLELENETLTTTEDHPFWSATEQAFVRADALHPGDLVLGASGQVINVIAATGGRAAAADAYNLEVGGIHTYHVGESEALVHNVCGVNLASPQRTSHILNGEQIAPNRFSGGHRGGTGYPGKSEFPVAWSDSRIMHEVSDIATDPSIPWVAGARPGDHWARGSRGGVDIDVLLRRGEIWTAYPTNIGRNLQ